MRKGDFDYKNVAINLLVLVVSALVVFYPRSWFQDSLFREVNDFSLLYFFTTFLLLDFVTYHWHYLNHRIPFLWQFHAVHHTDRDLNASSAFRFHFVEVVLGTSLRLGVFSLLGISLLYFLYYEVVFQFFNVFQHSRLRLPAKLDHYVSKVFITPNVHHYHHYDKLSPNEAANFGTILSIWDIVHRTFKNPKKLMPTGLPELTRRLNLKELLFLKFPR